MRLTDEQIAAIRTASKQIAGNDSKIRAAILIMKTLFNQSDIDTCFGV